MKLRWDEEGARWPNRETSRFVERGGFRWHVQVAGAGPPLLLLHGAGASTHSFRDLLPLLARAFTVIAPDLPGHAFTRSPRGFRPAIDAVAAAIAELLCALQLSPRILVGHSAGAAVATRLALDELDEVDQIVSLGGAFFPFAGLANSLFGAAARLLASGPLTAQLVALSAFDRAAVERLVRGTGSTIDDRGLALYTRLAQSPEHVRGVLAMLGAWRLEELVRDLPRLRPRLSLFAGARDAAIAPAQAHRVARLTPRGHTRMFAGLGHLLHEEAPDLLATAIAEEANGARAAVDLRRGAGPGPA